MQNALQAGLLTEQRPKRQSARDGVLRATVREVETASCYDGVLPRLKGESQCLNRTRLSSSVGVEEQREFALRSLQALIARSAEPPVASVFDENGIRPEPAHLVGRPIVGRVVYDDGLDGRGQGSEAFGNVLPVVVRNDDNRHSRHERNLPALASLVDALGIFCRL